MVLTEDDQVVQTFTPDRPDDSLGIGVLPGRLGRGEDLPDADRPDYPPESVAVRTIPDPATGSEARCRPPGKGLPDLLRGPPRRRV